jgi:hypothetical protein
MIKNPSWKLWPEVFVLIIPQVIRIQISKWEVVVCRPRRGMRILVFLLTIPQMIRIHFSEWEQVVSRRLEGVKMLKDNNMLASVAMTCGITRV